MKKLLLDLLSDSAMDELRTMEKENKIRILNEDDLKLLSEKREQIWKELEEYTYDNIMRKVKQPVE